MAEANQREDAYPPSESTKNEKSAGHKRIEYLFGLVNELRSLQCHVSLRSGSHLMPFHRSGNISYSEIVKRERFHPPVRKILMKMGVNKATDIKNSELLHSVISDIVLKRSSNVESGVSSGLVSSNTIELDKESNLSDDNNYHQVASPKKRDSKDSYKSSSISSAPPITVLKDETYSLHRKLILAVKAQNGRVRAVLNHIKPTPAVSADQLIAITNSICEILGTQRLHKSMSETEVAAAFDIYWTRTHPAPEVREESQELTEIDVHDTNASSSSNDILESTAPPSKASGIEPLLLTAIDDLPPISVSSSDDCNDSPSPLCMVGKGSVMYMDSPEKPNSLSDRQYTRSTLDFFDDEQDPRFLDDRTARIRLDSGESISSTSHLVAPRDYGAKPSGEARPESPSGYSPRLYNLLDQQSGGLNFCGFFVTFWEKVFALFFFVSNQQQPIEVCLQKVEGACPTYSLSSPLLPSPPLSSLFPSISFALNASLLRYRVAGRDYSRVRIACDSPRRGRGCAEGHV
jgi:hypothetical protein